MAALDGAAVQTFTADAKFGDVVSDLELRGWRQLPLTAAGAALRWRNLALTDFEGGEVLLNHLEGAQALSHKGSFARLVHDDSAAYYPKCFDARDEDHVAGMLLYITQVVAAQTLERLLALDACDGEENGMALACVEACHLFSSPRQSTRQLREALFQLTLWQNYFAPQFVAAYSDDGATPELADVDALWAAFFQDAPGLSKTARLGAEAALQRLASEDVQRLHAVRGTWLVKPVRRVSAMTFSRVGLGGRFVRRWHRVPREPLGRRSSGKGGEVAGRRPKVHRTAFDHPRPQVRRPAMGLGHLCRAAGLLWL